MTTEYVVFEDIGLKLLRLSIVARESFLGMGNKDTTIACSLHGTENPRPCSCASQTNIKVAFKWPGCVFLIQSFRKLQCPIRFSDAFVFVCKTEFRQRTSGNEQASGVGWKEN